MKTIYYLHEVGNDMPMYIGVTGQSLSMRLKSHKCSKGNSKREKWIRSAISGGGLGIRAIEVVEDCNAIEREVAWTNHYKALYDTVNIRIGNKGLKRRNTK